MKNRKDNISHSPIILTMLVSLLLLHVPVFAENIEIPQNLPELNEAAEEAVGTREGLPPIGLAPGETVTNFSIEQHTGDLVSFDSLKQKSTLLVIFYRGGWCPYCNVQIRQLTNAYPQFSERRILPVLISSDKPDASSLATKTYNIPFPVLSDPDMVAHDIFKVTMQITEELEKTYREYGIVLQDWSGKTHRKFAVASAFIVDQQGVIQWSHTALDYKTRPSVRQLLRAIDKYQEQKP
jgi:peroxiredoxin